LNDNQPEFSQSIWAYVDKAASQTRVDNGRAKYAENNTLLDQIEKQYDVPASIVVAIWGLESTYGSFIGDYDVLSALATLGWQGRRISYGRSQLIGAMKIIQNGFADRTQLKGSWAGAMGQTQFIPTTYLDYAVDANDDGRRNLWSDLDDVFASTANYLNVSGMRAATPWGGEATLPNGFDFALVDGPMKPAVEWASLGVATPTAAFLDRFDPNLSGRIIVPAGARGPAFFVTRSFDAILKYNRSTSYALAVGLLSDAVAGGEARVIQPWPRDDRPLTLSERKQLQQALSDAGYEPGPIDGIIGAGTKRALRRWQSSKGLPADGYASAATLTQLTTLN
ncbi:MAG: lytic murein transglycosylase, partial [Pseudomonadota bacterium]